MAISSDTRKAGPFLGNDATTVFPFTFKVFVEADLLVVHTDLLGIESNLVLDEDYTVELNADQDVSPGGSVTLLAALPEDERLTITSDVPALQSLVLTNNGGFYPRVINDAFDRITIIAQQLIEQVGRSLKLPISSTASATLPDPLANNLIGWNGDASAFINYSIEDLATVAGYADARVELFTGNGVQTQFVIDFNPGVLANLNIDISGVTQTKGVDFTWSGTTITFASPPPMGTRIQVVYARPITPIPDFEAILAAAEALNSGYIQYTDYTEDRSVGDALRAAIEAARLANKRVEIPAGEYVVDGFYNDDGVIGLDGAGLDADKRTVGLVCRNGEAVLKLPLTARPGLITTTLNSPIVTGDASAAFTSALIGHNIQNADGEYIGRVKSVESATSLTLYYPAWRVVSTPGAWTSANEARSFVTQTNGANFYVENIEFDCAAITSNFGHKTQAAGYIKGTKVRYRYKSLRFLDDADQPGVKAVSEWGIGHIDTVDVQGHGVTGGGDALTASMGSGFIGQVTCLNMTKSAFNVSVLGAETNLYVGRVSGIWDRWEKERMPYPSQYATLRLGNGAGNITVGYVWGEGMFRLIRLTDPDNCHVLGYGFRNILGPVVLFNSKDQVSVNSGVGVGFGVGPNRGNGRPLPGDEDGESISNPNEEAVVIAEGKGYGFGPATFSADEYIKGLGTIEATSGNASIVNKDTVFRGQDINCFDDLNVGDFLFTDGEVLLGQVLAISLKSYWSDAGSTVPIGTVGSGTVNVGLGGLTLTRTGGTSFVTQGITAGMFIINALGNIVGTVDTVSSASLTFTEGAAIAVNSATWSFVSGRSSAVNAKQTATLTGGSLQTVAAGSAYRQRTPDSYFYTEGGGLATVSGTAVTLPAPVDAPVGQTITASTSSKQIVGVNTDFVNQYAVGQHLFTAQTARTGTITCASGVDQIQGFDGALFLTELTVGSYVLNSAGALIGIVKSIESNTAATLFAGAALTQSPKGAWFSANRSIGQIASFGNTNNPPTETSTKLQLVQNAAVAVAGAGFRAGYNFQDVLVAGDALFKSDDTLIGEIATVNTAWSITLAATALTTITGEAYQFGRWRKVARGMEIAETAINTNVNLDHFWCEGAVTQYRLQQPTGIRPRGRDTITVAQLATISAVGRRGERWYISNMDAPGWVVSNGLNWIKENPNSVKTYSNTTAFSPTYIQYAPSLRLTGDVGAGTTAIITLPTTSDVPGGAVFTFFSSGTNAGTWQIGATLTRVRGGQWAIVACDKSSGTPVWRLIAAGNQGDRIPKITRGSGSPEGSILGSVGDLYTNLGGSQGNILWVKRSGDGTNTGWGNLASKLLLNVSATGALASSQINQIVVVDASGGAVTTTTPAVTGLEDGTWITIKKNDTTTNRVTVLFNGSATERAWLRTQHDEVTLIIRSGAWEVLSCNIAPYETIATVSGTWTKPPLLSHLDLTLVSGGAGGGSGRRGAAGTVRCGGNGGNGAGVIEASRSASVLPASCTYTIGAGGAGGAAVAVDDTNGNPGAAGGNTSFGTTSTDAWYAIAFGSGGGLGGTAAGATQSAPTQRSSYPSGTGASQSATGGVGQAPTEAYSHGGGSGGGITSANVYGAGGQGRNIASGGGGSGTAGGAATPGGAGPAGSAAAGVLSVIPSGSGGGAGEGGGAGGAGGQYGGAGGGGGASLNGTASGAGGAGANGCIRFVEYFT